MHLEDGNTMVVSGERRREKEGSNYVKMERRSQKLLKKFVLPENVNTESISVFYDAGVLTIIVKKPPPPEPKKPKVIEVKWGAEGGKGGGGRQEVKTSWHETEESHGEDLKNARGFCTMTAAGFWFLHQFHFLVLFMFDVHPCSS